MATHAEPTHADTWLWTERQASQLRRTPPSRPVLLLICVLALATGLTLLGASQAISFQPLPPPPSPETAPVPEAATALVQRFYTAVNDVLRTGDPAPLAGVVADDLVEHPARLAGTGLAGLVHTLLAERATWPDIRIVVDDVRAAGDDAMTVWVHPVAASGATVLGFNVSARPANWGPLEVLRVAGDRVVERWASGSDPLQIEPLAQQAGISADARPVLSLERSTFQPGASDPLPAGFGPRLIAVTAGAVTAALDRVPFDASVEGEHTVTDLVAGDALAIAEDTGGTLTNHDREPAVVLVASIFFPPPDRARSSTVAPPLVGDGVTALTLAYLELPETAEVTLARVTLAPGSSLIRSADIDPTMIYIESGSAWLTPDSGGAVESVTTEGHFRLRSTEQALVPGELVRLPDGLASTWQAGALDPLSLLVLTVDSATADSVASPSPAPTPRSGCAAGSTIPDCR